MLPPALFPPQTHQVPKTSFDEQDFEFRMKEIGLYIGLGVLGLIIMVLVFLLYQKKVNPAAGQGQGPQDQEGPPGAQAGQGGQQDAIRNANRG